MTISYPAYERHDNKRNPHTLIGMWCSDGNLLIQSYEKKRRFFNFKSIHNSIELMAFELNEIIKSEKTEGEIYRCERLRPGLTSDYYAVWAICEENDHIRIFDNHYHNESSVSVSREEWCALLKKCCEFRNGYMKSFHIFE